MIFTPNLPTGNPVGIIYLIREGIISYCVPEFGLVMVNEKDEIIL